MKKYLLAALAVAFVVGCASPAVAPVPGESLEGLKSEKIAVSYTLASTRINYLETLYRVLWLETKASSSDYAGLWDSAPADLSNVVSARLIQQGYAAAPVKAIVDRSVLDAANQELGKEMVARSAGAHPSISDAKLPPPAGFFMTLKPGGAHAEMLKALSDKGYRYLLELCAMDINGTGIGYGGVAVTALPQGRVIDLRTSKVVWMVALYHSEVYQLGGDLAKLEVDGMKKTKEGLTAGLNKMDFSALWGLGKAK